MTISPQNNSFYENRLATQKYDGAGISVFMLHLWAKFSASIHPSSVRFRMIPTPSFLRPVPFSSIIRPSA
jgi:hypothetical protein